MPLGGLGAQGEPLGKLLVHAAARGDVQGASAMLSSPGVLVDTVDANGWTALHHAARQGHAELASLLLAAGAQPSPLSRTGPCTPLHCAARADGAGAAPAEVVHLLLRYDADPRERDHRQQTPLHVAAKCGNVGAARALLADVRIDPTALDIDGKAAIQWATQLGHAELARLVPSSGPPMTTLKLLRKQILAERKAAEAKQVKARGTSAARRPASAVTL
ncbi:hypothetical protein KFE25_008377 [Diacronema lutheri]|uniref:Uncharacterized protein n=1 Tax=Diacronema lutheri TaxID=2081491 RepID=A0A8J5X8S0_DIALT|nr:hypothetical protein KFE25_008377 [Diacronema lutheri]